MAYLVIRERIRNIIHISGRYFSNLFSSVNAIDLFSCRERGVVRCHADRTKVITKSIAPKTCTFGDRI